MYLIKIVRRWIFGKNKNFIRIILLLSFVFVTYFIRQAFIIHDPYLDPLPTIETKPNCENLFNENTDAGFFKAAESWNIPDSEVLSDSQITLRIKENCEFFLNNQRYIFQFSSIDEEYFPIAYSIVVFKSPQQFEKLLRLIYRPWNFYCIHVDKKSDQQTFDLIDSLVNCLNKKYKNMINIHDRIEVNWGEKSVLLADLKCMKKLYEQYATWRYVINLTGQEFPLKTNFELVKILKAFKGANNVDGTYRFRDEARMPTVKLPFPVTWFKGSVHVVINREFVRFINESYKAQKILEALSNTYIPDEQFFSTLNYNAQFRIPGSFIGNPDEHVENGESVSFFLARFKNRNQYSCVSRETVRGLCIWGAGDLPKLVRAPHLFANKFYENFQPITLQCLEKWYYDKLQKEMRTGIAVVNESFYSSLPFVIYQYTPEQ